MENVYCSICSMIKVPEIAGILLSPKLVQDLPPFHPLYIIYRVAPPPCLHTKLGIVIMQVSPDSERASSQRENKSYFNQSSQAKVMPLLVQQGWHSAMTCTRLSGNCLTLNFLVFMDFKTKEVAQGFFVDCLSD